MSNNKEKRIYKDTVHLFLALQRKNQQGKKNCIRHVIKRNEQEELKVFEAKLKAIAGEWIIHRTVNSRDTKKAYKWFMKRMIDFPERASCIDTIWRTALLQKECRATKYFMLDVDTNREDELEKLEETIPAILCNRDKYWDSGIVLNRIESPNGWHYITQPFDTREVCNLGYVTLLRDSYFYVKTVGEKDE